MIKNLDRNKKLERLYQEAQSDIVSSSLEQLEQVRVKYLGRKGLLTEILRGLGNLKEKERPLVGKLANQVRQAIEEGLENKKIQEKKDHNGRKLKGEGIDLTLPGRRFRLGRKHVITKVIEEIVEIFLGLGYNVVETREVETDYYNFTALNTPPDHPARSLQATFYIENQQIRRKTKDSEILLRAHTSTAQIRVMEKEKPPLYVVVPGKAFRRDIPDPSHSPMFHQVEGFAVDEKITFGDLKGTLEAFCHEMFGADRKVRFRPHYFPFTEPSAEVDISCIVCGGKGCRICSKTGWLEILGAGMIDPNVLLEVGYEQDRISGFAFGMGPDRIAMLKYGIPDIRMFFENDLRFLEQF